MCLLNLCTWLNDWAHTYLYEDSSICYRCCLVTKSCLTCFETPMGYRCLLCPWDFPGKNTRVGCHCLVWGPFLTQGSNPCLLNWQVVTQDWKRSVFIPIPKKGNAKECSNYHTIALITHASKVMLKILQARLQQYVNPELPDVQAGFRKGRGTKDQIANIRWITEKAREFQKNIYFCFIDYVKAFDCVDHHKLWKILQEMGIPDHLTCLLRNLYAGQEATVRTGYGTTDWFQIGKGVLVLRPHGL